MIGRGVQLEMQDMVRAFMVGLGINRGYQAQGAFMLEIGIVAMGQPEIEMIPVGLDGNLVIVAVVDRQQKRGGEEQGLQMGEGG